MDQILIQGGRVVDPGSGFDQTADVLIENGVIVEIGRIGNGRSGGLVDAEGCIVCPGLIDPHVHLREPDPEHRETIASGAEAAAAGGFTTICCMPNTRPALDTAKLIDLVHRKGVQANESRVFAVGCATRGREGVALADIQAMARAGAVAFSDDGDCIAESNLQDRVLRTVKQTGRCFMQHCQDESLTAGGVMNAGSLATKLGLKGWPREAEEIIIERDIRLNRSIGCRYHTQHISSGGSIPLLRRAQHDGLPVTGEVSPHHLLLTESDCASFDTNFKMNPPLRTRQDIAALKDAVAEGVISILATDHAPHLTELKEQSFDLAPFGIVGIECALPLYTRALIEDGVLDWPQMLAMLTIEPAKLTGLDRMGIGSLTLGGPADITVIDPDVRWTIDVDDFISAGRNCPFDGWNVRSRAIATIVGGRALNVVEPSRILTEI